MNISELQKAALALFAAREVGNRGSLEQMKAVCYCIRNRVKAGWHGESRAPWLTAIERAGEVAAHPPAVEAVEPNNRSFQMLLRDIDDIFYSAAPDGSEAGADLEGAIGNTHKFWLFVNRPQTEWFENHIAKDHKNHPSHANMGLMIFFE